MKLPVLKARTKMMGGKKQTFSSEYLRLPDDVMELVVVVVIISIA